MKKNVMTGSYVNYANNKELVGFKFYTNLSASEKVKFINFVTDTLVDKNYCSILRDMIFDYAIISNFTDVDISEVQESKNSINLIEDLLEETNIVAIVKANAEEGLIDELSKAVDDNIEYRTGIHKSSLGDALAKLLNTIEKKISDVDTDSMMEMAKKLSNMTGELTPESIVEAYSKSDAFKNHMDEVNAKRQKAFEITESIVKAMNKK